MSSTDKDVEMRSSSGALSRVSDLWWDDGNVVIKAGRKLFRVFRGILASRSPVFADMFTVPQPEDTEKVEGCPLVELPDDPDEVEYFIRAIFDNSFLYFDNADSTSKGSTCPAVVGVLRLSHKYNVPHLRRYAIRHLESRFPTDYISYQLILRPSFQFNAEQMSHLLSIISVAREVGAIWILPVAFYTLTREWIASSEITEALGSDHQLLDTYLLGAAKQSHSYLSILKFLSFAPESVDRYGCTTLAACSFGRLRGLTELDFWNNNGLNEYWSDPLKVWKPKDWDALTLCDTCAISAQKEYKLAVDTFWQDLPSMYGLPTWPELVALRRETMVVQDGPD